MSRGIQSIEMNIESMQLTLFQVWVKDAPITLTSESLWMPLHRPRITTITTDCQISQIIRRIR